MVYTKTLTDAEFIQFLDETDPVQARCADMLLSRPDPETEAVIAGEEITHLEEVLIKVSSLAEDIEAEAEADGGDTAKINKWALEIQDLLTKVPTGENERVNS